MPTPDKTPMHLSTNGPEDVPAFCPIEVPCTGTPSNSSPTTVHSAEIAARLQSLSTVMNALLNAQSGGSFRTTVLSVQKKLRQFHLESYHSAHEVIIEAYLRTRVQIEKGKEIDSLLKWMHAVSFNIIREYSRHSIRNTRLLRENTRAIASFSGEITSPTYVNEQTVHRLVLVMNSMSDRDHEILNLRIVEGLKWREIKARLFQMHQVDISEATLRKQGERALQRLRRAFDSP